ncbi:hypothetical protein T4D_1554 [Trichinella pseudospiralis]|uniref:Uncharacterized protein n=1 Tax=Trichinella pseudospiralis TaxID=6337 RepID=A0A0V1G6N9_TRIPS|nr:hypothetical protein T4D_1554 [Trichinella pseudospiralis]
MTHHQVLFSLKQPTAGTASDQVNLLLDVFFAMKLQIFTGAGLPRTVDNTAGIVEHRLGGPFSPVLLLAVSVES